MRGDAVFVLVVLVSSLLLFLTERLAVEVVALLAVLALMLSGVLPPGDALAGFSDPLVVTIGALFVVGGAVQHTGLGAALGERLTRVAGTSEARLVAATMLASAGLSAFMSTTGTVALLLPVIVGVARRAGCPPSRLLLPLAYGGHLGSTLTLVATPPNLIASEQLVSHGLPGLGFFSFTPVGLVLLATGVAYMALVGRHLLPAGGRTLAPRDGSDVDPVSPQLMGKLSRLAVAPGGPAVGRAIEAAAPRSRTSVTIIAVQDAKGELTAAGPGTTLAAGEVLVVHGEPDAVARLAAELHLEAAPRSPDDVDPGAQGEQLGTVEALLAPRSSLLGKSLVDVRLRDRAGVTALSILRHGLPVQDDMARTPLALGDVLLLHGPWARLAALRDEANDLIVLGPLAPRRQPARRKLITAAVIVAMVALMATAVVPMVAAALLAAIALVLTRCITLEDAYRGVSWSGLILIAGMLPMATALQRTEAVSVLVDGLASGLGPLGPTAAMAGMFLVTSLVGQFLSNTATAVLMAPITYEVALRLGASPRVFLVATALGASAAFATPLASPVNSLVLAPGGYRFGDYLRAGLPLQALALLVAVIVLTLFPP